MTDLDTARQACIDAALVALEQGDVPGAQACAQDGLARLGQNPLLWRIVGLAAQLQGEDAQAQQAWAQAMALHPVPEVGHPLAALHEAKGEAALALACYRQLIDAGSATATTWVRVGLLHLRQREWPAAEQALRTALWLDEHDAAAHTDLGLVLEALGRDDEAEHHHRQALALAPTAVPVLCHLADLRARRGDEPEAQRLYEQALTLAPDSAIAHSNLGVLHFDSDRLDAAEAQFRAALAVNPQMASARLNLGQTLLCRGEFIEGWAEHEVRYRADVPGALPAFPREALHTARCWQGQPLAGCSLLVWPEQGFGDQIQFCRYLAWLKTLGPRQLTLVTHTPLLPLMQRLAGPDAVLTLEQGAAALSTHDFWVPLLSLPQRAGTELPTVPAEVPYLAADPARAARWAAHLPPRQAGRRVGVRVGVVWRGQALHANDADRSLPGLSTLAPLWSVPGITFISLQKGAGEDEPLHPPTEQPLLALGSNIQDFDDTAALLAELDLLITVDTAPAHLAGALNLPCWVLLPARRCDWRWLRGREDSPWYPSLRLFRQPVRGDWATPVTRVREALTEWAASGLTQQ